MESLKLHTSTFNNELPRLPPSTLGGENLLGKGTRGALKEKRGIHSQTSTGRERSDLFWLCSGTAPTEGWWPLVPTRPADSSFRRTLLFCSSIAVSFFFFLIDQISRSILNMDLKLCKLRVDHGYYNFQTQVSKLRRNICAYWRESPWLYNWKGNCKVLYIRSDKLRAGLPGQFLKTPRKTAKLNSLHNEIRMIVPRVTLYMAVTEPVLQDFRRRVQTRFSSFLGTHYPDVCKDNYSSAVFFILLHETIQPHFSLC